MWTQKEADLALHPVVGLVLQEGDTEKLPHALGFKNPDPFLRVSMQGPCFTAIEDGVTQDLYSLNLLAKLMVLHHQILFSLAIATIAEAILRRIAAEQVPFLHRVAPKYLKLVTCSNFWSFTLISALKLFVLLVMILFFSVLTFVPYTVALSTNLLVKS